MFKLRWDFCLKKMFSSASVDIRLSIGINEVTYNMCYTKCQCNDAFWPKNLGVVLSEKQAGHQL